MSPDTAIKTAQAIQANPVTSIVTILVCAVVMLLTIAKLSGNRKREIAELRTEVNTLTAPVAEQKTNTEWIKGTNNTQDGIIAKIDKRSLKNERRIGVLEQTVERGFAVVNEKIDEFTKSNDRVGKSFSGFIKETTTLITVTQNERREQAKRFEKMDERFLAIAEKLGIETNDK